VEADKAVIIDVEVLQEEAALRVQHMRRLTLNNEQCVETMTNNSPQHTYAITKQGLLKNAQQE